MDQVGWARDRAERLLAGPLPRRWAHSRGVGRKAESIAGLLGDDGDVLVAAAWLHDIGYAPAVVTTGFHPLDGAVYLRDVVGVDPDVCRLVAYHSCASIEASRRGLAESMAAAFAPVGGVLAAALTFCDMTTSPDGEPVDVEARLAEILSRYGPGHLVSESIVQAAPQIRRSVRTVVDLIADS
ncbi:HD domain-containing protein [Streptacidiphilus sp. MAP12-16]|uniref:HD domain-containing protein n=1 Tax=Streptacidiphilus sp. MAP12-16 TaxID=3156300 RepID=UPI003515DD6E